MKSKRTKIGSQELPSVYRLLPRQLLLYWLDGRFAGTSNRATKYNSLGWSLLLRGFYWYCVRNVSHTDKPVEHAGFCIIDLDETDIFFGGLRLFETEKKNKGGAPFKLEPILWRSTILKLSAKPDEAVIEFAYGGRFVDGFDEDELRGLPELLTECINAFSEKQPNNPEPAREWFENMYRPIATWLNKNLNEIWSDQESQEIDPALPYVLVRRRLTRDQLEDQKQADLTFSADYLPTSTSEVQRRELTFTRINLEKL